MNRLALMSLCLPFAVACSSAGTDSTPAAASSSGGATVDPDAFTLTFDTFTVPPGGEVYKCQNFDNPFGGVDTDVQGFESHMAKGSHHLLLFYRHGVKAGPAEDCSGLEFAATPYSTQLPDDGITLPDGVAALVKGDTSLRLQTHYLNATAEPIEAHVTLTLHRAKAGTVKDHAGVLFVVEPNIDIAPGTKGVVKHDCKLPYDMNLIKASSHMHKHGTAFTASIAGDTVFETNTWDDPKPALFAPAKAVHGGDPLSFQCTFDNTEATSLTFGESAKTNEMCIFVSAFYPLPAGGVPTVGCD